jgi:uncharacterized protein with PIN domain
MSPEPRFITDRMLGTLTRYLRFMGYNTISANSGFKEGNAKEDTLLLACAEREDRILLTRDAELSRRGKERAVLVRSEDVMEQVQQLVDRGLIVRRLVMNRCSLCNTTLRTATDDEIAGAEYAPRDRSGLTFFWCRQCSRLYWNGSHTKQLIIRIGQEKRSRYT